MRILLALVIVALFQLSISDPAEARRRGIPLRSLFDSEGPSWDGRDFSNFNAYKSSSPLGRAGGFARSTFFFIFSTRQELSFVSETQLTGPNDEALSLCHLTTKHHTFSFGWWRFSDGYALSATKCEGVSYSPTTEAQIRQARLDGAVPANAPVTPKFSLEEIITGFSALGLFALFILFTICTAIGIRSRRRKRDRQLEGASFYDRSVLEVMCYAALSDGKVRDAEIDLIQRTAQDFTRRNFSSSEIKTLVRSCERKPSTKRFKALGEGLDNQQKVAAMRAALIVIASDGEIAKKEQKFVAGLASGFGLSADGLQRIVSSLRQPVGA